MLTPSLPAARTEFAPAISDGGTVTLAAYDISDRLTALLNATHTIRLVTPDDHPVVAIALRTIEQQVGHLYRWVEELARGGE